MPEVRPGNATVNVAGGETLAALQEAAAAVGQWLPVDADGRVTIAELCASRDGGPREARYGPLRARVLSLERRRPALRHRGGQGRRGLRRAPRVARRDPGRAGDAAARRAAAVADATRSCAAPTRSRWPRGCARCRPLPRRSSCWPKTSWRSPTTRPRPRPTGATSDLAAAAAAAGAEIEQLDVAAWVARCAALPAHPRPAGGPRRAGVPAAGSTRPGCTTPDGGSPSWRTRAVAAQIAPHRPAPPPSAGARRARAGGDRAVSGLDLDHVASAHLDDLIDSCVSCGFCLPACPTFHLTGEESESPRGRIELVAALQAGELALDDVRPHLDRCLGCRACEPVCPSNVQYGEILELARGGGAVTRTHTVDATLAAVRHPGVVGAFVRVGRPFARLTPGRARRDGASDRSSAAHRLGAQAARSATRRGAARLRHAARVRTRPAGSRRPAGRLRLRRRGRTGSGLLRRAAPAQRRARSRASDSATPRSPRSRTTR